MYTCGACNDSIADDNLHAVCGNCKRRLHFNPQCAGLQEQTWAAKSKSAKESWVCVECRRNGVEYSDHSRSNSGVREKRSRSEAGLDDDSFKLADIEKLINTAVAKVVTDLTAVVQTSLETITSELGKLRLENDEMKQTLNAVEIRLTKVEDEHENSCRPNTQMEIRCDEIEQYSRKNNIVISGIPEIPKEHPLDTVSRIADKLQFDLRPQDIDASHRLPRRANNQELERPFLIKFVNRHLKDSFIAYCRKKKPKADLFGGSKSKNVYVNDHLTAKTAELRKYAAAKLVASGFKVGTVDCKVVAWKDGKYRKFVSKEEVDRYASTSANKSENSSIAER